MVNLLHNCNICPRNCGVDRINGQVGYCQSGIKIDVAKAYLHQWEEPCISGSRGSGTVFFAHCNLGCVYCQNFEISHQGKGKSVEEKRLGEIFLELQGKGAHNINLVTPTHFIPQIKTALDHSVLNGLKVPVVYNTNGYEKRESLQLLKDRVQVFLPDLKYSTTQSGQRYSDAPDYFKVASLAIEQMFAYQPECVFDEAGLLTRGVLVRHLVLPGLKDESKDILKYLYDTFGNQIYLSLMNQYTPIYEARTFQELQEPLSSDDYEEVIDYALELGIENCFIQESGTVSEYYIPDFDLGGV
jgi:putative pyruvate formate lyase activating enzyme